MNYLIKNKKNQLLSILVFIPVVIPMCLLLLLFSWRDRRYFNRRVNDLLNFGKYHDEAMEDYIKYKNLVLLPVTTFYYDDFPIGFYPLILCYKRIVDNYQFYIRQLVVVIEERDNVPKSDFLEHVDSETLYKNRNKAYDYLM